ncbi:MAG: hypothetical protein M3Y82_01935 [Verrucomicrobiota bacterium]|nr:hypothetical protein [Verrucomicrobiota bacterium]
MKKVDMSEQAILGRLKTVDQLRELCLCLMKAKKGLDQKSDKDKPNEAKRAKLKT